MLLFRRPPAAVPFTTVLRSVPPITAG
jgi:hypothetical protein